MDVVQDRGGNGFVYLEQGEKHGRQGEVGVDKAGGGF